MSNLSSGIMEKGLAKGRAEGMAQGMTKGRAEERLASIRSLMTNTGWPLDKAMEVLNVPEADRAKYAELLGK